MTERKTRTVRDRSVRVQLTDRDIEILTLVGLMGFVTSTMIAVEIFMAPGRSPDAARDACLRRTRKLFDAGYLHRYLVGSQHPDVLSLTRRGRAALEARLPEELTTRMRLVGAPRVGALRHRLDIASARLWVSALVRGGWFAKRGNHRTTSFIRHLERSSASGLSHKFVVRRPEPRTEHSLRWLSGYGGEADALGLRRVSPDGIALVDDTIAIAIEVDCGTESLRVIRGKVQRYRSVLAAGAVAEVWFIIDAGARRLRAIEEVLREAELEEVSRVMPLSITTPRPPTAPPPVVGVVTLPDVRRAAHPPDPRVTAVQRSAPVTQKGNEGRARNAAKIRPGSGGHPAAACAPEWGPVWGGEGGRDA